MGFASRISEFHGACGPHTPAENVGADDKVAIRVQGLAGSDHQRPPTFFARMWVGLGGELVTGQRMTDQNGVAALSVEHAIGLIGHRDRPNLDATIEGDLRCKAHPLAGHRLLLQACIVTDHRRRGDAGRTRDVRGDLGFVRRRDR